MHKEPIMGLHYVPYRETYTRDFGLYLWWAFCCLFNIKFMENKSIKQKIRNTYEDFISWWDHFIWINRGDWIWWGSFLVVSWLVYEFFIKTN